ncbi:MAG: hypothetical protein ACOYM3_00220 [Terrimicrobiaceae bacterium]
MKTAPLSRVCATVSLFFVFVVVSPCARAQVTNFTANGTTSSWNISGNWDNGIAGAGNTAVFNSPVRSVGSWSPGRSGNSGGSFS